MSECKPGTVWMVEAGCWANRKIALRLDEGWSHTNGVNVDGDGVVSPVRPLVVIDPENREEVERLTGCLAIAGATKNDLNYWREVQHALRSLIQPPKPEEPTGLGAVTEDAEGDIWVHDRDANPGYLGVEWLNVRTQAHRRWESIDAVRVLSEGVQP